MKSCYFRKKVACDLKSNFHDFIQVWSHLNWVIPTCFVSPNINIMVTNMIVTVLYRRALLNKKICSQLNLLSEPERYCQRLSKKVKNENWRMKNGLRIITECSEKFFPGETYVIIFLSITYTSGFHEMRKAFRRLLSFFINWP